jgi:hypothetical protein
MIDVVKSFIGDLARPFAIIVTSLAAAISTVWIGVVVAQKVESFEGAAIYIGAVFAGVGALYGAKAWELTKVAKARASERGGGDPRKVEVVNAPDNPAPVEAQP